MVLPTLVLIHGSWHSPEHFQPLIQALESQHGYTCLPVALPSTQSPILPPAGQEEDTAAVRTTVLSALESNNVVVIAHSYGGCPANNALENLTSPARTANGYNTSVLSLVFLSAIPLPAHTTFLSHLLGGKPHPMHAFSADEQFVSVAPPGPEYYFYNTLTPSEAAYWAGKLRPQAWRAYTEKTSYAAYRDLERVWYLMCTRDQAMIMEWQEGVVKGMEEDGAREVVVERVESDHSPFIGDSMAETVDFIRRAVEGKEMV